MSGGVEWWQWSALGGNSLCIDLVETLTMYSRKIEKRKLRPFELPAKVVFFFPGAHKSVCCG